MSKGDWRLRLDHILECIDNIERYLSGLDYEDLLENRMLMQALERNFEIIGEATRHIPDEIKRRYPDEDWSDIVGMRNILAHGYDSISPRTLWDTSQDEIKAFKATILAIKSLHDH